IGFSFLRGRRPKETGCIRSRARDAPRLEQGPRKGYFRCFPTSLVISNMLTWPFLKIGLSLSSALISRLFLVSCSLFFLMYAQSFFVTSVRGSGLLPTTSASSSEG